MIDRRLALKLLGAGSAWAQRRGSSEPPAQLIIDAVVTDAAFNSVRDLSPSDFIVTADGRSRAISSFAAVDALSGATRGAPPLPLPLKIDPGDLHRTFVMLVDDAGISAAAAQNLRAALMKFVDTQIGARDAVAVLRTSAGAGPMEQITTERAQMHAAIGQIASNPAAVAPSIPPWPQFLPYVLQGLRAIPGRKAVVVFADRIPKTCIFDPIVSLANRAWTSIYLLQSADVHEALCAPADLGAGTAGMVIAGDAATALPVIARHQATYYLLGFEPPASSVEVQVSRPRLSVQSRRQPAVTSPLTPYPDAGSSQAELRRILMDPFESGSMRMKISAAFSYTAAYQVEATLLIDGRDVTFTHHLNGTHDAAVDLLLRVYDAAGYLLVDHSAPAAISVATAAACQRIREEGLVADVRIPLRTPGVLEIYGAVRDATSGNSGIAHRLIEVPDISKGDLLLSGITLLPADASEGADRRHVFRPGQQLAYECGIYNVKPGDDKAAQLEVRTVIFTGGKEVYNGKALPVTVPDAANRPWLSLRGKLDLGSNIAPGEFVLQVLVKDKIGGRSASQWTEFTLR